MQPSVFLRFGGGTDGDRSPLGLVEAEWGGSLRIDAVLTHGTIIIEMDSFWCNAYPWYCKSRPCKGRWSTGEMGFVGDEALKLYSGDLAYKNGEEGLTTRVLGCLMGNTPLIPGTGWLSSLFEYRVQDLRLGITQLETD